MKTKKNKFGLVYDNAVTENMPGQVNIHPVAYMLNGNKIAANIYTPAGFDPDSDKQYPAVTCAHPNGGVKEADTKYMTDSAYEKAVNAKSKELFLIKGATHIRTYWVPEYVEQAADKLNEFFGREL